MTVSATAAEMADEKMWTKNASRMKPRSTAEMTGKPRRFSASKPAASRKRDCYTFETFASYPDEIRTAYYYHYKRTRNGLKEETTWS